MYAMISYKVVMDSSTHRPSNISFLTSIAYVRRWEGHMIYVNIMVRKQGYKITRYLKFATATSSISSEYSPYFANSTSASSIVFILFFFFVDVTIRFFVAVIIYFVLLLILCMS